MFLFYVKNFAPVGTFVFLHRFIFIYALLISIFHNFGMTPLMVASLVIIHDFSKIFCDPYTGALADKYGIRKILILGIVAKIIGIIMWIIEPNYMTFVAGMILIGVGRSCVVGKIESYGYNLLFTRGMVGIFGKLMITIMVADGLAATASGLVAVLLYKWHQLDAVLWATVLSMIGNIIFVLFCMPDDLADAPRLYNTQKISFILKTALSYVSKDKSLLMITILASLPGSMIAIYSNLAKMVMSDIHLKAETIFIIYSIEHILPIIVSGIIFCIKGSMQKAVKTALVITVIHTILAIIFTFKYGLYFIFNVVLYFALFPIINVALKSNLEVRLEVHTRATINSFSSLIGSILKIYSFIVVGVISNFLSYHIGIMTLISSMGIIILIVIYLYFQNQKTITNRP